MPKSMTGFARIEENTTWGTVACELRSVNHRYLEPTFRLPESLRGIENTLRIALKNKLSRGKVDAIVHVKYETTAQNDLSLNRPLVETLQSLAQQVSSGLDKSASINPLDILNWPGVLKSAEIDQQVLEDIVTRTFERTLKSLVDNRQREGRELHKAIVDRLTLLSEKVIKLRECLPNTLSAQQKKLRDKIDALNTDVDEDRLAQELVYIAQKSDVLEELDRLDAHATEVKRTVQQKQPIGRRLDFLMQELNREANTLSSKSISSETTQIAVDLKVLIEQMREQVQNIE